MESYRLIEIEEEFEDDEEEEEEDVEYYNEGEYGEDLLIPERIVPPTDVNFTFNVGDDEDDDDEEVDDYEDDYEEDEEEGEEGDDLFPVARLLPRGSIEDWDYEFEDEDEDYEFEDEDEDYEFEDEDEDFEFEDEDEDEEAEVEMMPPRVSSSISHSRTLQGPVVSNDGFLDYLDDWGKPMNQENDGSDGGEEEVNRGEIDGLFCPICFEAWTSGGEHQICCLPCGHIYGSSCITKWLQQRRSSGKCPQCNNVCTLKDVRVLYATRLCVADEELHKRVRSLEAKCAYLEQKRGRLSTAGASSSSPTPSIEQLIEDFAAWRSQVDARFTDLEAWRTQMDARFTDLEARGSQVEAQFNDLAERHAEMMSTTMEVREMLYDIRHHRGFLGGDGGDV